MADPKHGPSIPLDNGFAARVATVGVGDAPAVSAERAQAIVQETLAGAAKTDPLVAAALHNPDLTIVVVPGKNVNAFSTNFQENQAAYRSTNSAVAGLSRTRGDKKEIYIAADLPPERRANTLKHEMRHAGIATTYNSRTQTPFKMADRLMPASDGELSRVRFGDGSSRNRTYFAVIGDAMESLQNEALQHGGDNRPAIEMLRSELGMRRTYANETFYSEIPVRVADKLAKGEWTANDEKHFGGLRRFHEEVIMRDAALYAQDPAAYDSGRLKFPEVDVDQIRGRAPAAAAHPVAPEAPDAAAAEPATAIRQTPETVAIHSDTFKNFQKQLESFTSRAHSNDNMLSRMETYYAGWHIGDISDAELAKCYTDAGYSGKETQDSIRALGKRGRSSSTKIGEHKSQFLETFTEHLRLARDIEGAQTEFMAGAKNQNGHYYAAGETWEKFQGRMEEIGTRMEGLQKKYGALHESFKQPESNFYKEDPSRWPGTFDPESKRSIPDKINELRQEIGHLAEKTVAVSVAEAERMNLRRPPAAAAEEPHIRKPAPAAQETDAKPSPSPAAESSDNITKRPVTATAAPGEDIPPSRPASPAAEKSSPPPPADKPAVAEPVAADAPSVPVQEPQTAAPRVDAPEPAAAPSAENGNGSKQVTDAADAPLEHHSGPRYSGAAGSTMQTIIAAKDLKDAVDSGNTAVIATSGAGLAVNAANTVVEVGKDIGRISQGAGGTAVKYLGVLGTGLNAATAGVRIAQAETMEERLKIGIESGMQIGAGVTLATGTLGTVIGTGSAAAGTATAVALGGGATASVAGAIVAGAIPIAVAAGVAYDVAGVYKMGEAVFDTKVNYVRVDAAFQVDTFNCGNLLAAEGRILGNAQMAEELAAAGVPKNAEGKVTLQALNRALADRTHGDAVAGKLKELIERQRSGAEAAMADGSELGRYARADEAAMDKQTVFESAKMDERSFASALQEVDTLRQRAIDSRDRAEAHARYEEMQQQRQAKAEAVAQAKAAEEKALKPFKELDAGVQDLITRNMEKQYDASGRNGGFEEREAFVTAGQIAVINNPEALRQYVTLEKQTREAAARDLASQQERGVAGAFDIDALERQEAHQRAVAIHTPEAFDRQYARHQKDDAEYAEAKSRYSALPRHDKELVDAKLREGLKKYKSEGGRDAASYSREMLAFHTENVNDLRVHETLVKSQQQAEERFAGLSAGDKKLVMAAVEKEKEEVFGKYGYHEKDADLLDKYTQKGKLGELRLAAAERRERGLPEVEMAKKEPSEPPLGKEAPTSMASLMEVLVKDTAKYGEFTKLASNPQHVEDHKVTGDGSVKPAHVAAAPPPQENNRGV